MFIQPMNCKTMPDDFKPAPGEWVAEEKLDGHRIVMATGEEKRKPMSIHAWSRYGIERVLPPHIIDAMSWLPKGIYDGELLAPGKRSYGVKEKTNAADLIYVVFDILRLFDIPTVISHTYDQRREALEDIFSRVSAPYVQLAPAWPVNSQAEIQKRLIDVWERDGEGLILKRKASLYYPGKRSKDFLKLKKLQSAVMTVVGFKASRGQINDRGPYGMVRLRDDEGHEFTVKTLNDQEISYFEREADYHLAQHPAIGRKLRIEYVERTPDGAYWHPRWDRWEDE